MRSLLLLPVVFASVHSGLAAGADGGGWGLSLGGSVGSTPGGYVQVRENAVEGTRLGFRRDLGVGVSGSAWIEGVRRLSSRDGLRLRLESVFLRGSSRLSEDVLFNGATLAGGTDLRTRPDFYSLSASYERELLALPGGRLSGTIGLSYVFLQFRLQGTLSPRTSGTETQEDFLTQELPVPVLGLRFEKALSARLGVVGSAVAGYLPSTDSLRKEGGVVKLSQSGADVAIGIRVSLLPSVAADVGYRYTYFAQHEISREDDNLIHYWSHALATSLHVGF